MQAKLVTHSHRQQAKLENHDWNKQEMTGDLDSFKAQTYSVFKVYNSDNPCLLLIWGNSQYSVNTCNQNRPPYTWEKSKPAELTRTSLLYQAEHWEHDTNAGYLRWIINSQSRCNDKWNCKESNSPAGNSTSPTSIHTDVCKLSTCATIMHMTTWSEDRESISGSDPKRSCLHTLAHVEPDKCSFDQILMSISNPLWVAQITASRRVQTPFATSHPVLCLKAPGSCHSRQTIHKHSHICWSDTPILSQTSHNNDIETLRVHLDKPLLISLIALICTHVFLEHDKIFPVHCRFRISRCTAVFLTSAQISLFHSFTGHSLHWEHQKHEWWMWHFLFAVW